jgi:hypothetical protein
MIAPVLHTPCAPAIDDPTIDEDAVHLVEVMTQYKRLGTRHIVADPTMTELADHLGWSIARCFHAAVTAKIDRQLERWVQPTAKPGLTKTSLVLSAAVAAKYGLRLKANFLPFIPTFHWVAEKIIKKKIKRKSSTKMRTYLETDLRHDGNDFSLDTYRADRARNQVIDYIGNLIDANEAWHWQTGRGDSKKELALMETARENIQKAAAKGGSLLGVGGPWYPGKEGEAKEGEAGFLCPTCHGRPLTEMEYCIRCNHGMKHSYIPDPPEMPDPPDPPEPPIKKKRIRKPKGGKVGRPRKSRDSEYAVVA